MTRTNYVEYAKSYTVEIASLPILRSLQVSYATYRIMQNVEKY